MSENDFTYPNIDPKEWAELTGLDLTPRPCKKCGELQELTVPMYNKDVVGFESNHTKCGEGYKHFSFTFRDKKKSKQLGEFMEKLWKESL